MVSVMQALKALGVQEGLSIIWRGIGWSGLLILAAWDLFTCRLPWWCLLLFGTGALGEALSLGMWSLMARVLDGLIIGIPAWIGHRYHQVGGGDVICLVLTAFLLSPGQLTATLISGLLHCGIVSALAAWFHLNSGRIPFVPFLFLGALMAQEGLV